MITKDNLRRRGPQVHGVTHIHSEDERREGWRREMYSWRSNGRREPWRYEDEEARKEAQMMGQIGRAHV